MTKFKILVSLLLWQGALYAQNLTSILLKNATIIDGDAGVKPRIGSVLIENGLVKSVSYTSLKGVNSQTKVIDCTGKFVTPGLMDSHVHLGTGDLSNLKKAHATTDSILKNLLIHGITTVRDMAGNAPYLADCKKSIQEGKVSGPDIFYAAQFAGPSYFKMMSSGRKGERDLGTSAWYRAISTEADVKPAIAAAKKVGATGIKVYANLNKKLIREITDEAHKQGLLVWAHAAIFPSKPMDVAQSGVNSMSHANDLVFQQIKGDTIEIGAAWAQLYKRLKLDSNVRDQMLLEMKRRKTFLDPTVFHAENNKMVNAALITRRANELGIKMVTGTDWVYPTKNESIPLLEEMKLLSRKCGLTNLEVIEAATLNGALVTGLSDRGVVRTGKRADLLVLNADPLKSLDTFDKPAFVLKAGVVEFTLPVQ
ncbi:MAG: amidohydrolase family protein [Candidatus Pedobacter colombiensis]|uniref:Amidohydrolase family protein n=1 Tax=Candidatus Pedobacter colombiensis TaxID=3121371 RepID=A0AAJ5W7I4_9SPHI|nr:amidohydrolase family protein [Pedobacter sp.]WEK19988.1 MAG: amidohydrolase family protein [Pedobacter sp.]